MKPLNRLKLESLLKSTNGGFFTVKFIKKDKSVRVMNCRLKVKKYLKGGVNKVVSPDNSYMTAFDMKAKDYRTINLETVFEVSTNKERYIIQ